MTDFLLELRSEEIPARMQDKAREDLARLFTAELDKAGLKAAEIVTYATPRRLALIAKGLPQETEAVSEETKGPKAGAPPQAMEGFLRKVGLTQEQLVERDGVYFAVVEKPGRKTADVLAEAIPAIIRAFPWPKSQRWGAASISTESLRWVRPLQGIVALLGDDVVPCEIDGIVSSRETMGHRFMGRSTNPVRPEPVEGRAQPASEFRGSPSVASGSTSSARTVLLSSASTYAADLRAAHVIVDQEERRSIIRSGAEKAAADAGLVLVPDEGLVNENSGLTEWPVPMLGRFDPAYLEVPEEVIQLTARVNQKYFVCKNPPRLRGGGGEADGGGAQSGTSAETSSPLHRASAVPLPASGEDQLANAFVCTANIVANDGGAAIVAGNEKVLAARLSDAKFFWEQDLKIPLDEQAKKLSQITFHEKLGTVADKVERVAKLARWLVEEGIISLPQGETAMRSMAERNEISDLSGSSPDGAERPLPAGEVLDRAALADMAERAARLCKADLVTGMVGEFPELQGIMGGYYARAQGEADAIADAVRDHYKPVGQGDDVPTAPLTVAVSLADKLDTICGFFLIRQEPTGSKDPFALRRAAIASGNLALVNESRIPLLVAFANAILGYVETAYYWAQRATPEVVQQTANLNRWTELKQLATARGVFEGLPNRPQIETVDIQAAKELLEAVNLTGGEMVEQIKNMVAFMFDRLKVQQREAGVRHDLIDAVFALGGEDDLVRLLARVKALQGFVGTDEGANLLAGYKRAANILKQAEGESKNTVSPEPVEGRVGQESRASTSSARTAEEGLLEAALDSAEPKAAAAIEAEQFEDAMAALATLRAPIDAFFDGVMVNDPDPEKRAFRLGLLARFRDAVHRVADFSRIEG